MINDYWISVVVFTIIVLEHTKKAPPIFCKVPKMTIVSKSILIKKNSPSILHTRLYLSLLMCKLYWLILIYGFVNKCKKEIMNNITNELSELVGLWWNKIWTFRPLDYWTFGLLDRDHIIPVVNYCKSYLKSTLVR